MSRGGRVESEHDHELAIRGESVRGIGPTLRGESVRGIGPTLRGESARGNGPTLHDESTFGHEGCLICGYRNPWSLGMRFAPHEAGGVGGQFQANARWQGYDGILHGGVVAGLLDSAMVHCLFQRGIRGLTGDLHVRFVRPVACDATLDVHSWIEEATPPLYRLKAEIRVEDRILAWAEATFMEPRSALASNAPEAG